MSEGVHIRLARPDDVAAIAKIYAWHVRNGTGSFEEIAPDDDIMGQRFSDLTGRNYPWLVAVSGGEIVGYAYAGEHKARAAYRLTVEDAIYVAESACGIGIGRQLLSQLIVESSQRGFRMMMAVIGDRANLASIRLHERAGFRHIGIAERVGFKFGRELDIVFMQRGLDG